MCSAVFISLNISAAVEEPVATIVKMKGSVTKLLPGELEASLVMSDDKFPEDTSLVTGPKSFIKLKFIDNSEMTIGPESKIIISEMGLDSPGIIALLKGRIRTEVQSALNGDKSKNKFFIRTRTAAMGVRGTDFQTIYNPDNRVTSLLTYKGAVVMSRIDENTHKRFEEGTTEIVRVDKNRAPEIRVIPGKAIPEKDMLVKILNNPSTVIVPPGQTSFTSNSLKKSSLPVKISPVQLNALFKNKDFEEKNPVNKKSGIAVVNSRLEIQPASQVAPVQGSYNKKSGDYAPRAGGFIDQSTGLYIAPDDGAAFDDKYGVYLASNSGDFDADTGDYYPPQGLALDARHGFKLEKNSDNRPELLALREDLNRNIDLEILVGDLDGEVKHSSIKLEEKFIRDELTFSMRIGNQKIKLTPETGTAPDSDIKANGLFRFSVLWQTASNNRFSPLLGLTFSRVNYSALTERNESADAKSLFTMTTGLKYSLTNTVDIYSTLMLDQSHYASQNAASPAIYEYKRIIMTRLSAGVNAEVAKSNRFALVTDASVNMAFRKKFNSQVVSEVKGYNIKLIPQYSIDEKKSLGLGLYFGIENSTTTNTFGSTEHNRSDNGVELKYTVAL